MGTDSTLLIWFTVIMNSFILSYLGCLIQESDWKLCLSHDHFVWIFLDFSHLLLKCLQSILGYNSSIAWNIYMSIVFDVTIGIPANSQITLMYIYISLIWFLKYKGFFSLIKIHHVLYLTKPSPIWFNPSHTPWGQFGLKWSCFNYLPILVPEKNPPNPLFKITHKMQQRYFSYLLVNLITSLP